MSQGRGIQGHQGHGAEVHDDHSNKENDTYMTPQKRPSRLSAALGLMKPGNYGFCRTNHTHRGGHLKDEGNVHVPITMETNVQWMRMWFW